MVIVAGTKMVMAHMIFMAMLSMAMKFIQQLAKNTAVFVAVMVMTKLRHCVEAHTIKKIHFKDPPESFILATSLLFSNLYITPICESVKFFCQVLTKN